MFVCVRKTERQRKKTKETTSKTYEDFRRVLPLPLDLDPDEGRGELVEPLEEEEEEEDLVFFDESFSGS